MLISAFIHKRFSMFEYKKIWQFVFHNPFVTQHLFFYDATRNDFPKYFFEQSHEYEEKEDLFLKTQWLYLVNSSLAIFYFTAIGVSESGQTIALENNGLYDELVEIGDFCDLPYAILKCACYGMPNQKTQELFDQYPEFKQALDIYEAWCESQYITLDKNQCYHDANKTLFSQI
jgi:hypothetical protein